MITTALLIVVASLVAWLLWKAHKANQFWAERGIKHLKPVLFFGNQFPMILGTKSLQEITENVYCSFQEETVIGYYEFMTPRLFIRDPELIQKVMIKDFAHFTDHGIELDTEKYPREEQLFVMNGTRWRAFRSKISPIFTSGKLKDMYSTMSSVGENLLEYLKVRENEEIDARELMGLFSMDVIGSAVFGMDPATLKNPVCEFRKVGMKLFELNLKNIIRLWIVFACPGLTKKLGISPQDPYATRYFANIIQKILDYRREKGIQRNDLIQMMMQLKEKGSVEIQSWDTADDYLKSDEPQQNVKFEITDDLLMAQAQAFMVAGFEATALVMAYTIFELTQHQVYQEKVCEEISEQVKLNGGLTYDALKNMKLLESAIKETQRFYPVVPVLFRTCTKRYELPNGYIIEKGDNVAIPVTAIHMDPTNFPEPKTYKPERFLEPVKPGTYLPFGDGPRICIAMRYALMVIKYGLALFFLNYKVRLSEKTSVPLKINKRLFSAFPDEKILLKLQKIQP